MCITGYQLILLSVVKLHQKATYSFMNHPYID